MFFKIFQNIVEKGTFSTSFFDTSNTLITKLDQDRIKKHYKSISYEYRHNNDCQQNINRLNPEVYERIIYYDQVSFTLDARLV